MRPLPAAERQQPRPRRTHPAGDERLPVLRGLSVHKTLRVLRPRRAGARAAPELQHRPSGLEGRRDRGQRRGRRRGGGADLAGGVGLEEAAPRARAGQAAPAVLGTAARARGAECRGLAQPLPRAAQREQGRKRQRAGVRVPERHHKDGHCRRLLACLLPDADELRCERRWAYRCLSGSSIVGTSRVWSGTAEAPTRCPTVDETFCILHSAFCLPALRPSTHSHSTAQHSTARIQSLHTYTLHDPSTAYADPVTVLLRLAACRPVDLAYVTRFRFVYLLYLVWTRGGGRAGAVMELHLT
ncbi:hypothetical protein CALCODRAFT_306808 [Calocera cornea HHB12733]|uniref:Uncharacterized protein n=1 Tax=Calocera cornea HHB12733 TaxID=1353952 RepID=A0A165JM95_9BASI|nr:hypothetical protein CALCODRAFT_306808 [Calocera cornea HHB12733]